MAPTKEPTKPRRSADEIAKDKRDRLERSIERGKKVQLARIERRVSPAEGRSGDAVTDLHFERKRQAERDFQEGGLDYIEGRDSPLARAFVDEVARRQNAVLEMQRRKSVSSDLLNITGHTAKPSVKRQRQIDEASRLASGFRKIIIPDPDFPNQNVLVDTVVSPIDGLSSKRRKGKADPDYLNYQKAADEATKRFQDAYERQDHRGLQSPAISDRVDGGASGSGAALDIAIAAIDELKAVRASIGDRNYALLYVRLGIEASVRTLREAGGRQHVVNSHDFEVAMNALIAHYGGYPVIDPNWEAAQKMMVEAERIRKEDKGAS